MDAKPLSTFEALFKTTNKNVSNTTHTTNYIELIPPATDYMVLIPLDSTRLTPRVTNYIVLIPHATHCNYQYHVLRSCVSEY